MSTKARATYGSWPHIPGLSLEIRTWTRDAGVLIVKSARALRMATAERRVAVKSVVNIVNDIFRVRGEGEGRAEDGGLREERLVGELVGVG